MATGYDLMYFACRIASTFFDIFMRLLGPLLVLLATGLISMVVVTFFRTLMPTVTENFSAYWWANVVVGGWILFNIFFNYASCIFTSPGQPPKASAEESAALRDADASSASDPRNGGEYSKWCKTCNQPKPARCHHCHICKKCVLAMDHHCPWMANCVGFYNYRYFFLFLFYMFVGCVYASLISLEPFMLTFKRRSRGGGGLAHGERSTVVFTFVISISVGIAVGILLAWHVYLVLSAQTTIEFYFNRSKASRMRKLHGQVWVNEYDLGRRRNFQEIFGKGKYWFSFALPSWRKPVGDGVTFPTIRNATVYQNQSHIV